jgi:hypothetical protein
MSSLWEKDYHAQSLKNREDRTCNSSNYIRKARKALLRDGLTANFIKSFKDAIRQSSFDQEMGFFFVFCILRQYFAAFLAAVFDYWKFDIIVIMASKA